MKFKRIYPLHLLVLPSVIMLIIFQYIPMGGLIIAFQDYKPWFGILNSPWVGWENFRFIFEYPDSKVVIWNTFVIAFSKIITGLVVPFTFALLLNEIRIMAFKRTIQTIVYLPHFLSWVILGGILTDILSINNGLINQFVTWLGFEAIPFLQNGDWFRFTIISSDIWKEFGFSTIVYLAAITAINPELYEAAISDGANRWQQTLHITIPSIMPMTVLLGALSLGSILNAGFDQIFNLYNPLVYDKGDIIDTFVYRQGILGSQFSFSTAFGMFKSVISTILLVVFYRLAYKYANYRIF
ncbi:ABC transporter permease [Paenibacillus sp. strain BS8-2]